MEVFSNLRFENKNNSLFQIKDLKNTTIIHYSFLSFQYSFVPKKGGEEYAEPKYVRPGGHALLHPGAV
jgi:hypothetical protein